MRKITKAALVGGAAAAAIAAIVGMASPANAYSYAHSITTEIEWGGSYCIPTWSAGLYYRHTTAIDTLCSMKADGQSARDVAKYLGVSWATLYRYAADDAA
jgi:hypothetical protein